MKSFKAIVAGSVFVFVVLSLLGLVYIFIAVAYNELAADFPFLNDITGLFRYLVGIPIFVVTMFAGGYLTANIASTYSNMKIWFHSLAVALISVGGMIYSVMGYSGLTTTGVVLILLSLSASSAGGFYWLRGKSHAQS